MNASKYLEQYQSPPTWNDWLKWRWIIWSVLAVLSVSCVLKCWADTGSRPLEDAFRWFVASWSCKKWRCIQNRKEWDLTELDHLNSGIYSGVKLRNNIESQAFLNTASSNHHTICSIIITISLSTNFDCFIRQFLGLPTLDAWFHFLLCSHRWFATSQPCSKPKTYDLA